MVRLGLSSFVIGLSLLCSSAALAQHADKDELAEKMLVYQLANGGWPKQLVDKKAIDYSLPLTAALREKIQATDEQYACLDNGATSREIRALVKAFHKTGNDAYRRAAERGINYLLAAQYENGGFPQYYPNRMLYRAQVTFNDNAMINALLVLDAVAKQQDGFALFQDSALLNRATAAVEKGVACILRVQVRQGDRLSIWAAQYDEQTLLPAQARKFEPVSLSSAESVAIIRFLMAQPYTKAVEQAVDAAVAWLSSHDIRGYRFDKVRDANGKVTRDLVADENGLLWSRFYAIENSKPLFADRDNRVSYVFSEISEERRNGYAWFGNWPQALIEREYPDWKKRKTEHK